MANNINVGGRLHSIATGNTLAGANEILDDSKGKKQSEINIDVDNALTDRYTKDETYNKTELNNLITTPDVQYVTVVATEQTTVVTDILPSIGVANTIYRIGKWDGTQYNTAVYSEYAWDGSAYVLLDVKEYGIDDEPTAESDNLVKSGGVAAVNGSYTTNEEWIRIVTDSEGKILYGVKTDGEFVFGVGVPQSIKNYVLSQKAEVDADVLAEKTRAMAAEQALSTAKVDKEEGKSLIPTQYMGEIDNLAYVYVMIDDKGKILFGIKTDGEPYFGVGCPKQVKEYVEEKIADLSLDEYESIVDFIGNYLNNTTLEELLSKKVDGEYVDNPGFIEVKTDADNKLIEATREDGTKVIYGDLEVLGSLDINGVTYRIVSNPEWLKVVVDANDRIICGIKTDGKFVVHIADFLDDIEAIKTRLEELDAYSVTENPEFMEVELDAEGKVLSGRKTDGTKVENNDVELKGNATVGGSLEINSVVIETSEDPEGRSEITTDSEGRIVSYRDKDGVLHENVGIKAATLTLSESGLSDFETALKSIGLLGINDASDRDNIELPEPKNYGMLNLVIPALPVTDSATSEGYAEYYDFVGNTFKIACSIEMQGQTSKVFALTGGKGNYTLDLAKDIKFGSWVPQDSFHLKGCAKDITRGILSTSYKFAYTIQEYLQAKPNRVLMDEAAITTTNATGDRLTDWPTDARCIPDGFPCELYINGEYWGLYALQLKKHRKNYSMNKSDYTSFFLDADDFGMNQSNGGFWNGYIDWTKFEIKNPKDLYCMDGSKYDGDHPKELIDDTATGIYDATNKKHKGSKQTKEIIKSFSAKYLEVKALVDNNTTESLAEAKAKFAAYFDVDACIFVYIFNCMMYNTDSINKNTLWGIYSDGKIVPMLWDLDAMYGYNWIGVNVVSPSSSMWGTYSTSNWPLGLLWKLYESEIRATYIDLRSHGIISIDAWKAVIGSWVNRIGPEAFERDIEKWPETPSYRKNRTNTEYWEEVSVITSGLGSYTEWNDELVSSENDIVAVNMGSSNVYMLYKYINHESSSGNCPVKSFYSSFPTVGGFYDSPKRMEKWMTAQIALCDTLIGYSQ